MMASEVKRKVLVTLALIGLCATVAGCVSDMASPAADTSGSGQMRYFGGPKYPMWSAQQGATE
jgi:hypothetical protein